MLQAITSQAAIISLAGSAILVLALRTYLNYRNVVGSVPNHPSKFFFFSDSLTITNMLPHIPRVCVGQNWGLRINHKWFAEAGWDGSLKGHAHQFSIYPRVSMEIIIADPLAAKEVTANRSRFPKETDLYWALSFFGKNIVVTEGEEWKRHRKISAPAFSEKNNKLVWDESIRVMSEVFVNWGLDNPEVVLDHTGDLTLLTGLMVISAAGFGHRIHWDEDKRPPVGHRLSFREAIHTMSTNVVVKIMTPTWMYPFSKYLRHVQLAFDELEAHMQEMIDGRRNSVVKEERYDLFSALLDASEGDKEDDTITDRELIGNVFVFLLAGHETTANTLCFCLGLLALDEDEQEKMYQQIISVVPNNELPTYEQMNALTYPLAAFYEALRHYPSVPHIPKVCAEDTTIPVVQPDGTRGAMFIPQGARVQLNPTGLHYNPRYWPDPEAFKPSRFLGDWPRDAFLPFSGGMRACIGRKFAETEGVAVLTMLVRRYKIGLKDPGAYAGLSDAEKRAKLLANRPGLTTTPIKVPLVFVKR